MNKFKKIFLLFMAFCLFASVGIFAHYNKVSAEVDDTWLMKKYVNSKTLTHGDLIPSEFDIHTFPDAYSTIYWSTGSQLYVKFKPSSMMYVETELDDTTLYTPFARMDSPGDFIELHLNFSAVDVVRITYFSDHNSSDCSYDFMPGVTNATHADEKAKYVYVHILEALKTEDTVQSLNLFYDNLFGFPACVTEITILEEATAGDQLDITGLFYSKDNSNRYEMYSSLPGGGLEDNPSSSSDSSSSNGGLVEPPTDSDLADPWEFNFFDGSVDTEVPANSGTKNYYDMLTVEWLGISGGSSTITPTSINHSTYDLIWKSGGKNNSSRYIKFNIADNVEFFQIYVVIAPNGTSDADISVGGQKLFSTGKDKDVYTYAYSDPLPSGDYELEFTNSVRFANISFFVTLAPETEQPETSPKPEVVNNVAFYWVDDNGLRRHMFISWKDYQDFTKLPSPTDVSEGIFKGWYEDNGTYQDEFTYLDFLDYYSGIEEGVYKPSKAIYAKILAKDSEEIRKNDDVVMEKDPAELKPSNEPGDGQGQIICEHDFDFFDFFEFHCKKCGISFWVHLWNTIKYWVYGILAIIVALVIVKITLSLIRR